MKLTKVERVFVPIDKGEFPDINDEIKLPNLLYTYEDLTIKSGYNVHRNYLQEQNNKYLLSEEDIIKLISDAYKAGYDCSYDVHCGSPNENTLDIDEYINKILNS